MSKKLIHLMLVTALVLLADAANADITTDLLGYWKLDGNASDSSGNGYHGEEYGNPSYVPGIIGQAMDFNGSEQSVYIPDFTGIQNQDAVTVCMWVKADRGTGEDQVMWFTNEDGSHGRARLRIDNSEWEWRYGDGGSNITVESPVITDEWIYLVAVRQNGAKLELFVNGESVGETAFGNAGVAQAQGSIGAERRSPTSVREPFDGAIDEVRIYSRALTLADIQELFAYKGASPAVASDPTPPDEQTDVPRDTVLSWTPGDFAPAVNGHIVYLSESFNDVNDGVGGTTQSAGSYDPGRLELDTTYYWRVDEVNAPPDSTVYEGSVWSFTTEPIGYPIDGANIAAIASSAAEANFGPENTVNGSGLDPNGLHSADATDMWLSDNEPLRAWIQYELDKVYKLHEMWVWNSNQIFEPLFGFGMKDVTVEYSTNGTEWTALADVPEFARAPATEDYAHDTTVDFGGAVAQYVRLTATSNWGGILPQYGLSEVRFFS
ncbi:MAG: discoidin domain-containing protein, partial [Phycisphaerales bacterium]